MLMLLLIKVFTVLLRRSETTIAAIIRRRTPGRRRLALKRRLRLALLYTDAILRDLRRAADMLRARTGSRVLSMLNLAARTQRDAIWQAIHGTSAHPKKKKPQGRHAVSGRAVFDGRSGFDPRGVWPLARGSWPSPRKFCRTSLGVDFNPLRIPRFYFLAKPVYLCTTIRRLRLYRDRRDLI